MSPADSPNPTDTPDPANRLPNARDLGGHRTQDGRSVRRGLIFRSAAPAREDHLTALHEPGIARVYDLRTAGERDQRPVELPEAAVRVHADLLADEPDSGPASLGAIARAAVSGERPDFDADGLDRIFVEGYRSFATLPSSRRGTAGVLRRLAEPDSGPDLLYCTAGKDRTGWVASVILVTVGVGWDDVLADYMISGPNVMALLAPYREQFEAQGGDVAIMERAISTYPHYLAAAHEAAIADYGSWEDYLTGGLELDPAAIVALRERLLTP